MILLDTNIVIAFFNGNKWHNLYQMFINILLVDIITFFVLLWMFNFGYTRLYYRNADRIDRIPFSKKKILKIL